LVKFIKCGHRCFAPGRIFGPAFSRAPACVILYGEEAVPKEPDFGRAGKFIENGEEGCKWLF
jgi:hypothetical protein